MKLNESSVARQIIFQIQRYSLDDDAASLGDIGIDTVVAARIAKMDAKDLRILCNGSFLNISVDGCKLDNLIAYVDREKQQSDLVDRLILQDAPRKMMMQFFGLTGSEYVNLRKNQGLEKAPVGRWRNPTINMKSPQHRNFLSEINTHHNNSDDLMQLPETCLYLSDHYKFSVREVLTVWIRYPETLEWEIH